MYHGVFLKLGDTCILNVPSCIPWIGWVVGTESDMYSLNWVIGEYWMCYILFVTLDDSWVFNEPGCMEWYVYFECTMLYSLNSMIPEYWMYHVLLLKLGDSWMLNVPWFIP